MKKYEALVIGASFAAVGYALGRKNTLIVEKTEMLDTGFYLPMVGFEYENTIPPQALARSFWKYSTATPSFPAECKALMPLKLPCADFRKGIQRIFILNAE